MKPQLDMIGINVTNLKRMVACYRDVLGLEVTRFKINLQRSTHEIPGNRHRLSASDA